MIGLIKGDTRSLDNGSYSSGQVHPSFARSVSVPALVTPIISGDIATL